ncbi:hypothetical protein A8F94_14700 [Bacillus sp. FJAT-27225]|nr:hypothetical protein A8F94_14700 [Bacillus sp. FJAT-27225]
MKSLLNKRGRLIKEGCLFVRFDTNSEVKMFHFFFLLLAAKIAIKVPDKTVIHKINSIFFSSNR